MWEATFPVTGAGYGKDSAEVIGAPYGKSREPARTGERVPALGRLKRGRYFLRQLESPQGDSDIVAESLASDPEFSDIKVERVWKGQAPREWRKPYVQAVWRGERRIALEIQLSTTFLHVIVQRRLFYLKHGGLEERRTFAKRMPTIVVSDAAACGDGEW